MVAKRNVRFVDAQIENGCLMDVGVQCCTVKRGKVRSVFDLGNKVVLVTTDRISAFDVILPTGIPGKGWLLNQTSLFWFDLLRDIMDNHVLKKVPAPFGRKVFDGRVTVGKKTQVLPIEGVVRGYLTGSGWKSYLKSGEVCGIAIPPGMLQCGKLPEPIFTPTTKAPVGHDENITLAQMGRILEEFTPAGGRTSWAADMAEVIQRRSIRLYWQAAEYALERGIIIADTKFEWGLNPDGTLCWIDEALTPDSSRFWPADKYEPGRDQESFDKQFVRNYLQGLCDAGKWDKTENNIPVLPPEVVRGTVLRYVDAYERLTGKSVPPQIRQFCS
jgi:phosphoribosylaminoimidazole-succinocarboxamide synthase